MSKENPYIVLHRFFYCGQARNLINTDNYERNFLQYRESLVVAERPLIITEC